jgi:putative ABC transport system permease protein
MFKNYLKVCLRSLMKNKTFSFINIFGLAVSMSICLLLILMLADQSQYDQFHEQKERIYRIVSDRDNDPILTATSPQPLGVTLQEEYPIVDKATTLMSGVGGDATYMQNTMTMRGFFAAPNMFDIFSYKLEKGNKHLVLKEPGSIVLTAEFSEKLFGNVDPIGKVISFEDLGLLILDIGPMDNKPVDWGEFTVTGVLAKKDYKSHLQFDALISQSTLPVLIAEEKFEDRSNNWTNYFQCYTYALLKEGHEEAELQLALDDIAQRKYSEKEDYAAFALIAQKLTDITPGKFMSNFASFRLPIEVFYFLSFLALIIMLSACLNYTNLSVARSLTRTKEVGIRKVTGAFRRHLIWQFLGESIITSLLALVLAVLMLNIMKPAFMSLWINKYLNFNLSENIPIFIIFLFFAIAIGIIAGIIPSLHLSRFKPIQVLKGNENGKSGKLGLRKFMTVTQFVVSLFFIVTTILIFRQTKHYINFEYGFKTENIINVPLQGNDFELVSNELTSIPGVSNVSACQYLPATGFSVGSSLRIEGSEDDHIGMGSIFAHPKFLDNLGLEIVSGQNFSDYNTSKTEKTVIINESAVEKLGFESANDAIGQTVEIKGVDQNVQIAGVVKNFRFRMPWIEENIGPFVFRNGPDHFSYVNVKVNTKDLKNVVNEIEKRWAEIDPVHGFEYSYFDEQMARSYQLLTDVISIVGFFAFLSISIACLGLLGIATFTAERRVKEVGIRKVLGAGEFTIAFLLSKSFIKMLLVSIVIASPLVYFLNNLWLQNVSNKIDYGFGTIFLGTLIMLILGILTIGSQTLRASKANPADTLRME